MRLAFTLALCLLAGCSSRSPARDTAGQECHARPPADAVAFEASDVDALAGTFRLVKVLTSYVPDSAHWGLTRSRLVLRNVDSTTRAASREPYRFRVGRRPRVDLRLAGHWNWSDGTYPVDPAEVDAGVLYLGCRDCIDASPYVLTITARSGAGFWGTWRDHQTGIGRVFDRAGKALPDPAGYFCAWREQG